MSNYTVSPNMNLLIPTVGIDPGPEYAEDVNSSLTLVDGHNHSPGYGVAINPAGLDINSDLTFNDNNAIDLRSVRFQSQLAPLSLVTDIGCLYEVGNDLYYNDGLGNQVRLTQGGGPAGAPGNITGLVPPASAVYSPSLQTFIFQSNLNIAASLDGRNLILRNSSASSNSVTLQAPAALASNYSITLPTLPVSNAFLVIDSAGNITSPFYLDNSTLDISGSNELEVAPHGVTQDRLQIKSTGTSVGAGGVAIGTNSGAFSTSSTTPVSVTGASVTLVTTGRPVQVLLQPGVSSGSPDVNTMLLLHCDGSDTSTSFPDASAGAHVMTANGDAQVETAIVKFGTGALLLSGGGYLSTPGSSDFAFGSGDFTIDFWIYLTALASGGIVSNRTAAVTSAAYNLGFNQAQNAFEWSITGSLILSSGSGFSTGQFYHFAITRASSTLRMFVNGNQVSTTTDTNSYTNTSNLLYIGRDGADGSRPQAYIDEMRLSNVARWTSNFTPPNAPYGSSTSLGYLQVSAASGASQGTLTLNRDGSPIAQFLLGSSGTSLTSPAGCVQFLDVVTAGSHVYDLQAQTTGATPAISVSNCQLIVYET